MRCLVLCGVLAAMGVWTAGASAEEAATKENLAACKLPHGEILVPDRNTPEAKDGYILRFSDGTLNPVPKVEGKPPGSAREFLDLLRSRKTGDFMYSPLNEGSFMAVSGRMADLGSHLLSDLSGRRLDRPPSVQSKKERSASGEAAPGVLEGLEDGHCYLVETADGKFALVRLVQKRGRYALIQYVYQPSGEAVFDIPKGETIKVEPPRTYPTLVSPPPVSVPGKVTDVPTLLEIRRKMIAELMAVVAKPAKTDTEVLGKADAVRTLGQLRASEAAPLLVQEIEFLNIHEDSRAANLGTLYPCVAALQEIGKPGSLAALDAIGKLQLEGLAAEESKKAQFRLKLLVLVIKGVEGPEVAAFMIKSRAAKATDPAKAALDAALKEL